MATADPNPFGTATGAGLRAHEWVAVVDGLREVVIAVDPDNVIVYANAGVEGLLGWGAADLVGRPLTEVMPERFRERHLDGFRAHVAGREGALVGRPVRLAALRKDGTEVSVELLISAIALPGVGAVGLLRDVSERIELEGPADLSDRLLATMAESTTLEEAWPRVLAALVESLQWDVAQLWLTAGQTGALLRHSAWAAPESCFGGFLAASATSFARGVGLPGRAWDTFGPVWLPDLLAEGNFPRASAAFEAGLRSGFAFPVAAGGRLLGVIELFSAARRDPNPLVVERLRRVGQELGWFLDRRAGEEQRLALANTLQQSLLPPSLPTVSGVTFAARYLPAGSDTEVGGDFYDVFRISRGSWGVVIGDVCGKGPEAAAVTALARYTLRAAAAQFRSPARALDTLNDAMLRQVADGAPGRFVTTILARLAVKATGVDMTLACGGHPPPMVRRVSGKVERVGRPGTLIGVLARTEFHDTRVALGPGDVIVMVTDGVLEARRGDDQFGDQRLADVLAATTGATPAETVDAVVDAAVGFQRGRTVDDIAIIAVAAT